MIDLVILDAMWKIDMLTFIYVTHAVIMSTKPMNYCGCSYFDWHIQDSDVFQLHLSTNYASLNTFNCS